MPKYVYYFGQGEAEGNASMKNELGGKGANLAEMAGHKDLRLPVPPGFTITTEVCTYYYQHNRTYPAGLKREVERALARVEKAMGRKFGDPDNPLLVSVRSGARRSMPGMMETILNVGLNDKTREGLIRRTGNPRFVYDAHRRLIMMYSDVVMEKAAGIEPAEDQGIRRQLEREMERMKKDRGVENDVELTAEDLKELVEIFRAKVQEVFGRPFPEDPEEQLWGAIGAVFRSWVGKRAVSYRRIEGIPDEWGTAVNVQSMVFGNLGEDSATGVAFTRNPATGEDIFYGEWLPNAQGEDVVAGIRTPNPINEACRSEQQARIGLPSLEQTSPELYKQLMSIQKRLERHYRDMQDMEFTIEKGKLWILQTRTGKRNGPAAVRMAVDMHRERLIDVRTAVTRVTPAQLDELLHPILDPKEEAQHEPIAKGLPAGPGGATGQVVFTAADAVEWARQGKQVILVREETNPEDVEGMRAASAILTARGGMTSHAALVARGWGKCCVVGAGSIEMHLHERQFSVDSTVVKEGDWISINGTKGYVYLGQLPMVKAAEENPYFVEFMKLCDKVRRLGVRTNADTPEDAARARSFGAEGIGLFRTEHMFYGEGADEPLFKLRRMILSETEEERRAALDDLFPHVKADIKSTLEAMDGLPVTIRLLDPPLHEFVPQSDEKRQELARAINITVEELDRRAERLQESNPMMGHRGVRLGVTYPEVTEMQVRAILEAAAELLKASRKPLPEIMVPVVSLQGELNVTKAIVDRVYKEVLEKSGLKKIDFLYGTMVEIPRACLVSDKIAEVAEFFSFGTNDLTQMGFGFSRDDVGSFVPEYIEKRVLAADPFQTIDIEGIGQLIQMGIERGRAGRAAFAKANKLSKARAWLKVGICGEHGGDPESVKFCHRVGMDYVSCSPFRVPIAKLAAAQAVVEESEKATEKKPRPSAKKSAAKKRKAVSRR
mgnify:CR=1 FL=1